MRIAITSIFTQIRIVGLLLLTSLALSGCVQYDVGIHFANQTHGEIVQHVQIGEQLTSFSDTVAQEWLASIKQRTQQLGGQTRQVSSELVVTIPFSNGADLTEKFNQFFQSLPASDVPSDPALNDRPNAGSEPQLRSKLKLTQNNWLLIERDRLTYDLDLRPLGVLSANGNLLVSPGSLLNLHFSLDAPWGVRSVSANPTTPKQQGNQLVWTLKPGATNHLEAIFWLPSPLGIGTVAIVLLVLAGTYLKSQLFYQSEANTAQPGTPKV